MEYSSIKVIQREKEKLSSKINRQSLISESVISNQANQLISHNAIKVRSRSAHTSPTIRRKIHSEICK